MIFGFNGDLNNTKEFGIFVVLFLPTDFLWPSQTSPFSTVYPLHFSYIDLALLCVFQAYSLFRAFGLDVFMILPQIHKWLTFPHVSQWSFHQWVFPWTSHKYNSKCSSPALLHHNLFHSVAPTNTCHFIYLLLCLWSVLLQGGKLHKCRWF